MLDADVNLVEELLGAVLYVGMFLVAWYTRSRVLLRSWLAWSVVGGFLSLLQAIFGHPSILELAYHTLWILWGVICLAWAVEEFLDDSQSGRRP